VGDPPPVDADEVVAVVVETRLGVVTEQIEGGLDDAADGDCCEGPLTHSGVAVIPEPFISHFGLHGTITTNTSGCGVTLASGVVGEEEAVGHSI